MTVVYEESNTAVETGLPQLALMPLTCFVLVWAKVVFCELRNYFVIYITDFLECYRIA